jgi:hypothetical protein
MPAILPAIAAITGIASGVNSIAQSRRTQSSPQEAAAVADPAAGLRPFFQDQLMSNWNSLFDFDPNAILKDPAYQFTLNQSEQAGENALGSMGMLRSGTRVTDAQNRAAGVASQFESQYRADQLARLGMLGNFAGMNINPATSGQILSSGNAQGIVQGNLGWGNIGAGVQALQGVFPASSSGTPGGSTGTGSDAPVWI